MEVAQRTTGSSVVGLPIALNAACLWPCAQPAFVVRSYLTVSPTCPIRKKPVWALKGGARGGTEQEFGWVGLHEQRGGEKCHSGGEASGLP